MCLFLLTLPGYGQSELNLNGAIDFHAHSAPDSVYHSIDADDVARIAKGLGERGLVLKSHYEPTAELAYMVRKAVPGIELFGGVVLNLPVGGINIDAVKSMMSMKGGYGKVVWLPTFQAENAVKVAKGTGPFVSVSKDGHLLPSVLELIDFLAQHHEVVLETGHISAEEGLMVVHEAHQRGVTHIVVTHAMNSPISMTIPQMQQAAHDGAYLEFVYAGVFGAKAPHTISEFVEAIRAVGPQSCIIATDFGGTGSDPLHPVPHPSHAQGLLDFMEELHKAGISVDDVNMMAKTNPALALGLKP